ncbi:hypothetical protein Tco_0686256 [Tanacetum coccineum]
MNVDSLPSKWDDIVEERNAKHFKNETRSGECVQGLIEEIVKMRLMSLTVKDSKAINKVEEIWGINWIMGDIEMVGPQIYRMMPLIDANPISFCKVVAIEWLKIAFMKEM